MNGETDDGVVVCERWPLVRLDVPHQLIVMSLSRYEADLGMRTRGALQRQLAVDVPRCHVVVGDARVCDGEDPVWTTRVRHPRLCTQAVLAPPVEWLMRAGAVAHECKHRMEVYVSADGADVEVFKTLGVWVDDERTGTAWVHVHTDAAHDVIGIDLRLTYAQTRSE